MAYRDAITSLHAREMRMLKRNPQYPEEHAQPNERISLGTHVAPQYSEEHAQPNVRISLGTHVAPHRYPSLNTGSARFLKYLRLRLSVSKKLLGGAHRTFLFTSSRITN